MKSAVAQKRCWRASLRQVRLWSMSGRQICDLELEQRIRIAMCKLGQVCRGQRETIEKRTTLRVRCIGIVDREHDAVDPERQQRGEKRRLVENAAGSDPDLVEDGAADRPVQVIDLERKDLVDAVQH